VSSSPDAGSIPTRIHAGRLVPSVGPPHQGLGHRAPDVTADRHDDSGPKRTPPAPNRRGCSGLRTAPSTDRPTSPAAQDRQSLARRLPARGKCPRPGPAASIRARHRGRRPDLSGERPRPWTSRAAHENHGRATISGWAAYDGRHATAEGVTAAHQADRPTSGPGAGGPAEQPMAADQQGPPRVAWKKKPGTPKWQADKRKGRAKTRSRGGKKSFADVDGEGRSRPGKS